MDHTEVYFRHWISNQSDKRSKQAINDARESLNARVDTLERALDGFELIGKKQWLLYGEDGGLNNNRVQWETAGNIDMTSPKSGAEWNNYCIYSGKYLPEAAMNAEHVIPKSLGGNFSTVIRASKKLNSEFATQIDAPITRDPMVQFGRRDANARGHSKKEPMPVLRGAHLWKQGQPWYEPERRYTLEVPKGGGPIVHDRKTGGKSIGVNDGGYIIPDLKIDHVARLKFSAKTLLGIGWKYFRSDLLRSVDVDVLRHILSADLRIIEGEGEGRLRYSDPFLVRSEDSETHELVKIEKNLVRTDQTSVLMREFDGRLEWTVACVGYLVGSISIPVQTPLLKGDVQPRGGIRLTVKKDRLEPELVSPF